MKLKNRRAEFIQLVKVSLAKYVDMFCHDCSYNIRFIFTNTKLNVFRIQKNQNIPNTPFIKFQLLYRRSFQPKLFARDGKKVPVNSFIVD